MRLASLCQTEIIKFITRDELGIGCHIVGVASKQADSKTVVRR